MGFCFLVRDIESIFVVIDIEQSWRVFHTVHDCARLFVTNKTPEVNSSVGQRLIKARSGHGWSQQELSEVSGVAAAQISRYESGRNTPRPEVIAKLAKAVAVRFEWLAYGEGHIEDGTEVPRYPSSKKVWLELEVDDELRNAVESFAEDEGVSYEMAFNMLTREMVKHADELLAAYKAKNKPESGEK